MPVFLAGKLAATSIASSLGVPLYETTHQAGHVRAALLGQETLVNESPFLAMHLSGGTTEVLSLVDDRLTLLGGTLDLHAGQVVDRTGVALGLPFPAGTHLEELAVRGMAQGEYHSVPGGHMFPLERPTDTASLIKGLFDRWSQA